MPFYLFYPMAGAFLYTLAMLCIKRALAEGAGPWRVKFICNLTMGLTYLPILFWAEQPWSTLAWAPVALCGFTFLVGQIFTFLALHRGDVSVATPLLGTKVLFVAVLTVLLIGDTVPWPWWLGAFLVVAAIFLLRGDTALDRKRLLPSIGYSLISAFAFALTDVMLQKWVQHGGFGLFVPMMFGLMALFSFAFVPFFHEPLTRMPKKIWVWLLPGAILLAINALCMAYTISVYGHATAANIVYSSRGLWSVVLVWILGHWFANEERHAGLKVMRQRLLGASLLIVAIILVLV
jgi:drug/metabolite transporter (DMT)-like permease